MTEEFRPLYMMTQRNILTGETRVVYGHATSNVMSEFWEDYTDIEHVVEIQRIVQRSMMATPRPTKHLDRVKAERDRLKDMLEYVVNTDTMLQELDPAARASAQDFLLKQLRNMFQQISAKEG